MTDDLEKMFRQQALEIPEDDFPVRMARAVRKEIGVRRVVLSIATAAGLTTTALGWMAGGQALLDLLPRLELRNLLPDASMGQGLLTLGLGDMSLIILAGACLSWAIASAMMLVSD